MRENSRYKGVVRWLILVGISALIIVADQLSKYFVATRMSVHQEITIIPGFFRLCYVRNPGAGLGILANARWVFLLATCVIIVVIAVVLVRNALHNAFADISLTLIFAGGVGNMIDRICYGEVVDFFQFQIKLFDFIFNVADVAITFGAIMFIIYFLFFTGKNNPDEDRTDE